MRETEVGRMSNNQNFGVSTFCRIT